MAIAIYLFLAAQVAVPSAATPLTSKQAQALNDQIGRDYTRRTAPKIITTKAVSSNIFKPEFVNKNSIPSKDLIITEFNKRKSQVSKKVSIIKNSANTFGSCTKLDSLPIGTVLEGTEILNGRATILSCLNSSVIATIEEFDLSMPTNPAMSVSFGERTDYVDYIGGKLISNYMEAANLRKLHIYEWIGQHKTISLSVVSTDDINSSSLRDLALGIINYYHS